MKEGTYRTTRDLPAFLSDKRKRHDWRARPVPAGTLVRVTDEGPGPGMRVLRAWCGAYSFESVRVADFPAGSLEPVTETPSQWLQRTHSGMTVAPSILDTLVEGGRLTMADIQETAEAILNEKREKNG